MCCCGKNIFDQKLTFTAANVLFQNTNALIGGSRQNSFSQSLIKIALAK